MTKKEAVQLLAILKAAYPNFYKDMSAEEAQGTVSVWSMQFEELPAEIVLIALNKHIATNKFPPSIAEIKEKLTAIHWEAYDKLYQSFTPLTDEEASLYERIYAQTERYKYSSRIEPSVSQLIGGNKMKQLSEGEGR